MTRWGARRRVRRGIRLLDERGPAGWRGKLNLEDGKFRIMSPSQCIVGQLYGGWYGDGLKALGLPLLSPDAAKHGFVGGPEIEKAWRKELAHERH